MFDPSLASRSRSCRGRPFDNWENDIEDVAVEACDKTEDPTGYRILYYKSENQSVQEKVKAYCVGGSLLKNRLKKLKHAGFEAPMTQRALHMIDPNNSLTA